MLPRLLTIAGSDSGGGAGIQADLKTFLAFGGYGMSALTAVTAQNTCGVEGVEPLSPAFVALQIRAVVEDIGVDAAKCGMLFAAETVRAVAASLAAYSFPLVLDPVMVAKSGDRLLAADALVELRALLPRALVLTPNVPEARALAELPEDAPDEDVARRLQELGATWILLKGGHRSGEEVVDRLYGPGRVQEFRHPRHATRSTHGTGCTLSAAIAAGLGRGAPVPEAVAQAIAFVDGAMASAVPLGRGYGPLHHGFALPPFRGSSAHSGG
jgi:hydroxymethylpyrimidine/phosphomethylpyrimidine kinase